MKFRKLKSNDEKDVKLLLKQLTQEPIKFDIKLILKDKNCNCLVVEDNKKIIGFGALVLSIVPCRGYVGRIEDVFLDEKYRGQGLGRRMMEELLELAKKKKIKRLHLTSNPKRVEARRLYESLGFELSDTGVFKLKL